MRGEDGVNEWANAQGRRLGRACGRDKGVNWGAGGEGAGHVGQAEGCIYGSRATSRLSDSATQPRGTHICLAEIKVTLRPPLQVLVLARQGAWHLWHAVHPLPHEHVRPHAGANACEGQAGGAAVGAAWGAVWVGEAWHPKQGGGGCCVVPVQCPGVPGNGLCSSFSAFSASSSSCCCCCYCPIARGATPLADRQQWYSPRQQATHPFPATRPLPATHPTPVDPVDPSPLTPSTQCPTLNQPPSAPPNTPPSNVDLSCDTRCCCPNRRGRVAVRPITRGTPHAARLGEDPVAPREPIKRKKEKRKQNKIK